MADHNNTFWMRLIIIIIIKACVQRKQWMLFNVIITITDVIVCCCRWTGLGKSLVSRWKEIIWLLALSEKCRSRAVCVMSLSLFVWGSSRGWESWWWSFELDSFTLLQFLSILRMTDQDWSEWARDEARGRTDGRTDGWMDGQIDRWKVASWLEL